MKKTLLFVVMLMTLTVLLAVFVSADILYKEADGNTLFSAVDDNGDRIFDSYSGEFPHTDEGGNALTWYIASTEVVGEDTVHTVASFFTIDTTGEHASLSESGVYKYVNQAKELSIVSAYFPNDAGVVKLSLSGDGYGSSYQFDTDKSNILFLTLPNTLTEMPSRICQATPIIDCTVDDDALVQSYGVTVFYKAKNMRSVDIPANVTIIYSNGHANDGFPFYECLSLVDVHFAENSRLETIQLNSFNSCKGLKEITLPNSLVNLGARAFQGCSSLETVRLGANVGKGLTEYNVQSMFYLCDSLKYVYFSETIAPTAGSHMFYNGATGMVFFYTGDYEQYEAFKAVLVSLKDSGKFTNATPILWDSTKNDQYYKDMAEADGKNYVVYGYGRCEAFYGGHAMSGEESVTVNSYFEPMTVGDFCTREGCGKAIVTNTIGAIFTWKGYSASTFGEGYSVVQGYYVNQAAIDDYMVYAPDFDYGILATVNKTGDAITPKVGDEGVLSGKFVKNANDYLDIKLTGIPAGHEDTYIVFCVYVTVGEKMYYLNNEETTESVMGNTYNEILNGGNK